ncbi:hypothetical protein [Bradyrhizobium ivorense]|nr:hypothetical protein [Bradyrhizobium ivorense]
MTEIENHIEQLERTAAERALVADLSTTIDIRVENARLADELRLLAARLRAQQQRKARAH